MSVWAYVVISAACIALILLDIRGIRIYRALRGRGIPVKARCMGVNREERGLYTIVLNYTHTDGKVYQFKEGSFKAPVRMGDELDALYDPAGYAPPTVASRVTRKRAFPYFTVVCLPLLVAATSAYINGI
ncbi:DUF3592 domain-containing protein [Streptomyces sp. NPDC048324]|uniref:DUF3592 domain-containing protein n=1 Tax=Streptomyces sp. NPDC048324 TaxID=3157205 RepID=UPI003436D667